MKDILLGLLGLVLFVPAVAYFALMVWYAASILVPVGVVALAVLALTGRSPRYPQRGPGKH